MYHIIAVLSEQIGEQNLSSTSEFFFIDLTTLITKKFIIITVIINTIFFIMIIIIIYNIAIRARCCSRDQQASMHLKPNAPLTLL